MLPLKLNILLYLVCMGVDCRVNGQERVVSGVVCCMKKSCTEVNRQKEKKGRECEVLVRCCCVSLAMQKDVSAVGFEPTSANTVELESTPLDRSGTLTSFLSSSSHIIHKHTHSQHMHK